MQQLFGLVLGALIGLWAGPVGAVFPVVAFVKRLPYRWGALLGYVVGLGGAMYVYQHLDAWVFAEPELERVAPPVPAVEPPAEAPVARVDHGTPVRSEMPAWLIAVIPGALVATLGVAGAGWILATSDDGRERNE